MKKAIRIFVVLALIAAACFLLREKVSAALNNKALGLRESKELDSAIFLLKQSLNIYPTVEAQYNLGCIYEDQNREEDALHAYKNALAIDLDYKQAYEGIMDIYLTQKNYNTAISFAREMKTKGYKGDVEKNLKRLNSQKIKGVFNEAVRSYRQREYVKAMVRFKQVLKVDPEFTQALQALGIIYFDLNQWEQAIEYYEQAVQKGVHEQTIYNNIGISYMQLEQYEKAVLYLQKAYDLDPKNVDVCYNLASTLRDNKEFEKALSLYVKIAKKEPYYPNIHNNMAGIYEALGQGEIAQKEFEQELENVENKVGRADLKPFDCERMAIAYSGLGQLEKAKSILDEVIVTNPSSRRAYYKRAQVYNKLGLKSQAESDLNKARALIPNKFFTKIQAQEMESLWPAAPVSQDLEKFVEDTIIYLKNGRKMRGCLKRNTQDKVVLEMSMGNTLGTVTLGKGRIKRIEHIE
ncbi:MAG: tetratricopeptide repeat protein [PVC group bacterium]|nr:tetratricopeptide repeat protein [PVC group bacterium]